MGGRVVSCYENRDGSDVGVLRKNVGCYEKWGPVVDYFRI